ncbi:MAG: hypothetical protein QOE88_2114, partial [Verrucomicrobiota bacterium]|nr:hypothetical protein [Verrucomicrobiota bacterium]
RQAPLSSVQKFITFSEFFLRSEFFSQVIEAAGSSIFISEDPPPDASRDGLLT